METWQQDSSRMVGLCGPLEAQAMPDHAGNGPGLEIADSADVRNSTIRRFLISVVLVVMLLVVSRPAQVQDDAEASHLDGYDQLEDFNDPLGSGSDNPKKATVPTVGVETRLARVTAYWPEDGDYYTRRRMSSTGLSLRDGHCAVDPRVIPYGSTVKIPGVGEFVAVDTGSAVVSRRAARVVGRTSDERNALVVDVYCSSRSKARALVASAPRFAVISWYEKKPKTSPQESLAFNR